MVRFARTQNGLVPCVLEPVRAERGWPRAAFPIPISRESMFTGIIEERGRLRSVEALDGGRRLTVACSFAQALRVDESVSVNGVCLTVVRVRDGAFEAVAVEETLAKTTLGMLASPVEVNLERAIRVDQRLGGHLVQGHVDGIGAIEAVEPLADSRLYRIAYDPDKAHWLVSSGSVAVDGISLTVARLDDDAFTVSIVPHTLASTNVSSWQVGGRVNVEFDLIGKYVSRWIEKGRPS